MNQHQQSEKEALNHVHVQAREVYEKPAIEIIEMETEGIFCASANVNKWGAGGRSGNYGAN